MKAKDMLKEIYEFVPKYIEFDYFLQHVEQWARECTWEEVDKILTRSKFTRCGKPVKPNVIEAIRKKSYMESYKSIYNAVVKHIYTNRFDMDSVISFDLTEGAEDILNFTVEDLDI